MESEPEISVEVPTEKSRFGGISRMRIIFLVIISAFIFGVLLVVFLLVSKYLGLWSSSDKKPPKNCGNCTKKKSTQDTKDSTNDIETLDKLISDNDAESESIEPKIVEIDDRQDLSNVEVEKDPDVNVDEHTSYESSSDSNDS